MIVPAKASVHQGTVQRTHLVERLLDGGLGVDDFAGAIDTLLGQAEGEEPGNERSDPAHSG